MTTINAPGDLPTPKRVEFVVRKSTGLDEVPDEPTPEFYVPVFTKFLTDHPGDDHFLLEMPDKRNPSLGGNGFGTITCMEDGCFVDIILTADPDIPDGGRSVGLGSLYEYGVHCQSAEHVRWRDKRLAKQGIAIPSKSNVAQPATASGYLSRHPVDNRNVRLPSAVNFAPSSAHAGPSRLGATSSAPSSSAITPGSLSALDLNVLEWRSQTPTYVVADSDSDDDDIQFIGSTSSQMSSSSRNGRDVKPTLGHSIIGRSPSNRPNQPQPLWASKWATMSMMERLNAAKLEDRQLKHLKPNHPEDKRAVQKRREELTRIIASSGMKSWAPPSAELLRAVPTLIVDPKLVNTFERPVVVQPPQASSTVQTAAVAGPSRVLAVHQTPAAPSGPAPAGMWTNLWNGVDMATRKLFLGKEFRLLQQYYKLFAGGQVDPIIKNDLTQRFVDVYKWVKAPQTAKWKPASPLLLRQFPELRNATHPSLLQFLGPQGPQAVSAPTVGGMAMDDSDYGYEFNRPQGQQLHDFFQSALADFAEDSTIEDGLKTLGLGSKDDKIPGATFTLMPHQVLGVAFMCKREDNKKVPGGLLCDAMGLGKTVQCISLMLLRDERPSDYARHCPQLIIAPLALLQQWKSEIETKTTKDWRILIHHGANRPKSASALKRYDIILTTYGTMMSESGLSKDKKNKKKKRSRPADSDEESDYEPPAPKGPLFGVKWFRVTMDEAHMIRNKSTTTSKAAMLLDVLHPWILTGTPVVNSLADLGPAITFLGAMSPEDFHARVPKVEKNKPRLAARRAQAILRPIMMRRHKDTEINGVRILQLPTKTTNMAVLEFEPEERAMYAALEARARMKVNKYIKQGTLMKHYSVILVLLTRLRQMVNHPWLLRRKPGEEQHEGDVLVDDDIFDSDMLKCRSNDADEYGRAVGLVGQNAVDEMKKKLEERYKAITDENVNSEPQDMECSVCYDAFEEGQERITPCLHIYCHTCLESIFNQPLREGAQLADDEIQKGCRPCPMCRKVLSPGHIFKCSAFFQPPQDEKPDVEEAEEDTRSEEEIDRKGKKRARDEAAAAFFDKKPKLDKGKGRATDAIDVDDDVDELMDEEQIPASTKTRHVVELVKGYIAEDKNCRILLFSQFVQFLDLVEHFLKEAGIRSITYSGAMNQGQRDEAIRRFSMPTAIADNIPIMLLSTKAGGVGLNLTMAHKVICCDLAWNPATENQAVDRAHRIGQTKPVQVERLVIRDTVEDRLLEIQERKGLLADGAMGEGAGVGRLGRLTLDDVRKLFAIDREYDRSEE